MSTKRRSSRAGDSVTQSELDLNGNDLNGKFDFVTKGSQNSYTNQSVNQLITWLIDQSIDNFNTVSGLTATH